MSVSPFSAVLRAGGTDDEMAEAAFALSRLDPNVEHNVAIRSQGGIPLLVRLAENGSDRGKEAAAAALANISPNNQRNREAIRNAGGVQALLGLLSGDSSVQCNCEAAHALRNLAYCDAISKRAIHQAGGISKLLLLVEHGRSTSCQVNAMGALRTVMVGTRDEVRQSVCQAGGANAFVQLIDSGDIALAEEGIAALWNLIFSSDPGIGRVIINAVREAGAIANIVRFAESEAATDAAREYAAAALRNVAGNSSGDPVTDESTHAELREAGGVPCLVMLAERGGTEECKYFAACAFKALALSSSNHGPIRAAGGIAALNQLDQHGPSHKCRSAARTALGRIPVEAQDQHPPVPVQEGEQVPTVQDKNALRQARANIGNKNLAP